MRALSGNQKKNRKPLYSKDLRFVSLQSGRQDLNLRLLGPKPDFELYPVYLK